MRVIVFILNLYEYAIHEFVFFIMIKNNLLREPHTIIFHTFINSEIIFFLVCI